MTQFKQNFLAAILVVLGLYAISSRSMAEVRADRWRPQVQAQADTSQQQYAGCLFGDSISSGLGNSLGNGFANFGVGGLSSVSLLDQLKALTSMDVQCQKVIIAIGTNDAWNSIQDDVFVNNLKQAVSLARQMGATQITLIPAFYSTVAASHNPSIAGTLDRVDEINQLVQKVAVSEKVAIVTSELRPLYSQRSLKKELTFDGVHLNDKGKKIYRQVVLKIFTNS
ncbi:SGNH/GDSL hydrolase family protein [Phormidesmis priestleyi]